MLPMSSLHKRDIAILRKHAALLILTVLVITTCSFNRPHVSATPEPTRRLQLLLMHRHSSSSPFKKYYNTTLEALEDTIMLDVARLHGFQKQLSWTKDKDFRSTVKPAAAVGTGQYFVEFYIGTPPQRLMLIVDTGSDLIWVRCGSSDQPRFRSNASSSYFSIPCTSKQCLRDSSQPQFSCDSRISKTCNYDYIYSDGAQTRGIFSRETVTLNSMDGKSTNLSNVGFGCGVKNTGESLVNSGGVLGLGRGSTSFASQIDWLAGNKFSYCLADFFKTPTQESYLTFGDGIDSSVKLNQQLQHTPLLRNPASPSFYYVGINAVTVNGRLLPIPSYVWKVDAAGNRGTIIDSGTTLTFLVEPAYRLIVAAMRAALIYPQVPPPLAIFDLCFNASGVSDMKLPQLTIVLQGNANFAPPARNYFIHVTDDVRCLGLQRVQSPSGLSILGNLLQQNIYIEYDRENGQLGFASAICNHAG